MSYENGGWEICSSAQHISTRLWANSHCSRATDLGHTLRPRQFKVEQKSFLFTQVWWRNCGDTDSRPRKMAFLILIEVISVGNYQWRWCSLKVPFWVYVPLKGSGQRSLSHFSVTQVGALAPTSALADRHDGCNGIHRNSWVGEYTYSPLTVADSLQVMERQPEWLVGTFVLP